MPVFLSSREYICLADLPAAAKKTEHTAGLNLFSHLIDLVIELCHLPEFISFRSICDTESKQASGIHADCLIAEHDVWRVLHLFRDGPMAVQQRHTYRIATQRCVLVSNT